MLGKNSAGIKNTLKRSITNPFRENVNIFCCMPHIISYLSKRGRGKATQKQFVCVNHLQSNFHNHRKEDHGLSLSCSTGAVDLITIKVKQSKTFETLFSLPQNTQFNMSIGKTPTEPGEFPRKLTFRTINYHLDCYQHRPLEGRPIGRRLRRFRMGPARKNLTKIHCNKFLNRCSG